MTTFTALQNTILQDILVIITPFNIQHDINYKGKKLVMFCADIDQRSIIQSGIKELMVSKYPKQVCRFERDYTCSKPSVLEFKF